MCTKTTAYEGSSTGSFCAQYYCLGPSKTHRPLRRDKLAAMAPYQLLASLVFISRVLLSKPWSVNNFLISGPRAYHVYTRSVQLGAQKGIEECKFQFAWDRWNCPETALQLFTQNGLRGATKERAFVQAIGTAGVMYTLTKNCSKGDFPNCGCDDSRVGTIGGRGWIWGGCSDNVDFGSSVSKQFVDALETGRDARAAVNLHNNEVGRLAVRATMKRTCKCHGISGSCSVQTCFVQLSDFREIGNYLKVKHVQAYKLEMDKKRGRDGNTAVKGVSIGNTLRTIGQTELIYLEDSLDYCVKNSSLGLQGTEGRECLQEGPHLSQWEKQSCRRLCQECGLKVEERLTEKVSSCKCKFRWCCTVRCDKCTEPVTKFYCGQRTAEEEEDARRRHGSQNG
ncbi:protein Wnt-8a-like [Arapaima gigas]